MYRWVALSAIAAVLAGCTTAGEPMNISRDAFKTYLSKSGVGTDEILNKTLPEVRTGNEAYVSGRDELGNKCRVQVYVDPEHPMLLHVNTTRSQPCPDCGGSGIRGTVGGFVNLRCLTCDGSGEGEPLKTRKYYRVKPGDLEAGTVSEKPN